MSQSPDQALQSVLDAMTDYTAEPELGTFSSVMEAVTRYGRACRRDEQQLSLAEVTRTRELVGLLVPPASRAAETERAHEGS